MYFLPSQYTWRIILLLSLAFSCIVLTLQFPFGLYGPDVSFHAAKLLRVSSGELFVDPFTAVPTIYPTIFHAVFGLVKQSLDLDSVQTIQLIILVEFIGLFAAFWYFAAAFFNSAEETSLCVLALPLVFWAPTGRYALLAVPSNFSFVFLIFSLGALYRYVITRRLRYLIAGGLLASFAVNIWWINVFSIVPILLVLSYYTIARGPSPKPSDIILFILALLVPCVYTVWHLYAIWDILPNYFTARSENLLNYFGVNSTDVSFLDNLTTWIAYVLTKGNLRFWDYSSYSNSSDSTALANWQKVYAVALLHAFSLLLAVFVYLMLLRKAKPAASLVRTLAIGSAAVVVLSIVVASYFAVNLSALFPIGHYFFLVLPFNLLLIVHVCRMFLRKDNGVPRPVRTLAMGGLFVLLSSLMLPLMYGERVQFIGYVMFLLVAYKTMPLVVISSEWKKLSVYICMASLMALMYTVVYSPSVSASKLPEGDEAVVRFLAEIPNHDNEWIFVLDGCRQKLSPFVTFRSLIGKRKGLYHAQDRITASKMYEDYISIKEKKTNWRNVVRERNIKWFIFRTSDQTELAVFNQYANDGSVYLKNRDWIVLEMSL